MNEPNISRKQKQQPQNQKFTMENLPPKKKQRKLSELQSTPQRQEQQNPIQKEKKQLSVYDPITKISTQTPTTPETTIISETQPDT